MDSANTDSLSAAWRALPEGLKTKLRLGFTGKSHLLDIAGWCLRSGNLALNPIANNAIETAVRENPLDGAMAAELLALAPIRTLLNPDIVTRLTSLSTNWRIPADLEDYRHHLATRDFAAIKTYITQAVADDPDNLYWMEQATTIGCIDNDIEFCTESLNKNTANGVEKNISDTETTVTALFTPQATPKAQALMNAVAATPWNIHLALRAYDTLKGICNKRAALPGTTAILLYSWNKAAELDATLASLLESDLGNASIFVLNNGSTDGTADMLDKWSERFASELGAARFTVITLPVNIGAAAARNWLMHLEAVQTHDFICYLDDDVELPVDWLPRLGAAVDEYPEAGVWGCKVVDHANTVLMQSADTHLLAAPEPTMDLGRAAPNPFRLSDLHIQTLDSGLFDFMRPCASVTGCCHLFRTTTLLESGDFALQLSPSQYDDMEHDLRLCEAELFPVYQGHLTVHHKKRSGAASRTSMQEEGNALGNKYKMQTMHEAGDIAAAMQAEQQLLEGDILRKLAFLDEWGTA
ncbi:glycosyltransferase family 2 protein [Pseudodesulfovibrio sediminis]|uniref:Glycosyl transferase family 2 n=1 Tax=Pseudodesulfovibrio sediminis TaxID=2810563 RepID=A0ABM8HZ51_9BACT|nr:glycosyltransferase [Pseudodesulfovibrio sediminis]BCS88474.1 glycosyl transferase family 2 [Pseudodesulfovibrio sediminis]